MIRPINIIIIPFDSDNCIIKVIELKKASMNNSQL